MRIPTLVFGAIVLWFLINAHHLSQCQEVRPASQDIDVVTYDPQVKDVRAIAVGDAHAWVLGKDSLAAIDADTNHIATVRLEEFKEYGYSHLSLAVGGGSAWIYGIAHRVGGIHRIDVKTGKCVATVPFEKLKGNVYLRYGLGSVWAIHSYQGTLIKVDPATDRVSATIELGKGFWLPIQIASGSLFTVGMETGMAKRIDPDSNDVAEQFVVAGPQQNGLLTMPIKGGLYAFSAFAESLWIADIKLNGAYKLSRIDLRSHLPLAKLQIDGSYGAPEFWNGSVWVSTTGNRATDHLITEIDAHTNQVVRQFSLSEELKHAPFSARDSEPAILLADQHGLWAFTGGIPFVYSHFLVRRLQARP